MIKFYFTTILISLYFIGFSQKTEEKTINSWLDNNNYQSSDYLYSISLPTSINKMSLMSLK
jgi:hypothetical protein